MEEIAGTEKHTKLLFIGELSPTPQMWFCGEKQSVTLSDWSRRAMSPDGTLPTAPPPRLTPSGQDAEMVIRMTGQRTHLQGQIYYRPAWIEYFRPDG